MKLSDIKRIRDRFAGNEWREAVERIIDGEADFTCNGHRWICSDDIDEIQQEELGADEYILGCFNASFLARVLDAPVEAIKALQGAEAFEAIGKWIIENGKLEELQEGYAGADGYGHHFNSYDFSEEELMITGCPAYHIFENAAR